MLSPEEYTAFLATDQIAFTEEVFNTVSPNHKYDDNWHIHCLPYDSLIHTENGLLPIGYIVENKYSGLVASFNHNSSTIEWKKITQYHINPCSPLIELIYSTGESLKITRNHPVWINGEYINAENIRKGDKGLRILQESFSGHSMGKNKILRKNVFWKKQSSSKKYNLPYMQRCKMLYCHPLFTLRQGIQKEWKRVCLWILQETNIHNASDLQQGEKNKGRFLQPCMLWQVCKWCKCPWLYRRKKGPDLSQSSIPANKKEGLGKRWSHLFSMLRTSRRAPSGYASYRQRQNKQRDVESCNSLPHVSQPAKRNLSGDIEIGECYVQEITRCLRLPKKTYNLGVEGHNNYFAGGILVHNCIIEHLKAVEKGEIQRLIINMPPRTLKSITVSVAWSAWLLGRDPKRQIMGASYGQDLATEHSINTRLVMESEWYNKCFPKTIIAEGENKQTKFKTTERGHRMAYSVGASRIGHGGDYLVMDDPINPEEALSDVTRNSTNTWIEQSFMTRINDPRKMKAVLVMQRLHENDPTGFLMSKGNWHHLSLPAQFIKKTFIQINNKSWLKNEGEYLDPVRLSNEILNQKLIDHGAYGFSGQFMQNPAPIGGGEFKNEYIQYYDNYDAAFSVAGMNVFILYDPANSKKSAANNDPDYTAIVVVGLAKDNNYYILDLVRDRLNPTERVELLFELHKKWNKKCGKPPKVVSEQYGMMTDNFYIKRKQTELNYRFPVTEVKGQMKKEDRIRRLIPIFESKRVYLPQKIIYSSVDGKQYELVKQFVDDEMVVFPVGRHDDMLDAFARILDEDVRASFPQISTIYLSPGQSLADATNKGYDPQNPMSW